MTTQSGTPRRILFIAPHADDIEVMCYSTCQAAVDAGFEVHECLASADEYGTAKVEWRGRRIARIRKWEMQRSTLKYGMDKHGKSRIQLHWMPFIDGHVPFNALSVQKYQKLIEEIQPWAIFGPDPFFPYGLHDDHIHTGQNYYFALKGLDTAKRPKIMLFYQTFNAEIVLPFLSLQKEFEARMGHRSQWSPVLMKIFGVVGWLWKRSIAFQMKAGDKYRKVVFSSTQNFVSETKWNLKLRWKRAFWMYALKLGYAKPSFFKKPSSTEILQDYNRNGWV